MGKASRSGLRRRRSWPAMAEPSRQSRLFRGKSLIPRRRLQPLRRGQWRRGCPSNWARKHLISQNLPIAVSPQDHVWDHAQRIAKFPAKTMPYWHHVSSFVIIEIRGFEVNLSGRISSGMLHGHHMDSHRCRCVQTRSRQWPEDARGPRPSVSMMMLTPCGACLRSRL